MNINESEIVCQIFEKEFLFKEENIRFYKVIGSDYVGFNSNSGLASVSFQGKGARWLVQFYPFCIDSHILKEILGFNLTQFKSNLMVRDKD